MDKQQQKTFLRYYNTFFEKIYRYIFFRIGRDHQLAEDLTSEVMLKAYENFGRFDTDKKFSVWIYRIAHNHLVDYYKKGRVEQVSLNELENVLAQDDKLPQLMNKAFDRQQVEEILHLLPEQQRDIIILKFMEDLSTKEIAEILNVQESHVRVLQHRAIKFLRSRLSFLHN